MGKKKKVKKFQLGGPAAGGGDPRRVMSGSVGDQLLPGSMSGLSSGLPNPFGGAGPSGHSRGASGAVDMVLQAGNQAQNYLGEADQALRGTSQRMRVGGGAPPYKKGGKVAKKKASGKLRGVGKAKKGVRPVKMVKMKG